jgi:hypothetical protein
VQKIRGGCPFPRCVAGAWLMEGRAELTNSDNEAVSYTFTTEKIPAIFQPGSNLSLCTKVRSAES